MIDTGHGLLLFLNGLGQTVFASKNFLDEILLGISWQIIALANLMKATLSS